MNSLPEGAIGGDGVMLSITPSFFPEGAKSQMSVWDLNPWNVILFSWTLIDRSVLSSSLSFWKTPWVTYASFWGKLIWFVILHFQSMCHSTDHFLDQQVTINEETKDGADTQYLVSFNHLSYDTDHLSFHIFQLSIASILSGEQHQIDASYFSSTYMLWKSRN